jgi:beta-aspartyl-peptidase (threonine type)
MNKSVHVLLSGAGADEFAREHGLELVDNSYFNTPRRFEALQQAKQKIAAQTKHSSAMLYQQPDKFGTVGVVVLDRQGNLVAGTFADNASCAVSATGHGEYFIRYQVASDICKRMQYQEQTLQTAADHVIHDVLAPAGGDGGVVAVDAKGNVAMPFNTAGMYRASIDRDGNKVIAIFGDPQ